MADFVLASAVAASASVLNSLFGFAEKRRVDEGLRLWGGAIFVKVECFVLGRLDGDGDVAVGDEAAHAK